MQSITVKYLTLATAKIPPLATILATTKPQADQTMQRVLSPHPRRDKEDSGRGWENFCSDESIGNDNNHDYQ